MHDSLWIIWITLKRMTWYDFEFLIYISVENLIFCEYWLCSYRITYLPLWNHLNFKEWGWGAFNSFFRNYTLCTVDRSSLLVRIQSEANWWRRFCHLHSFFVQCAMTFEQLPPCLAASLQKVSWRDVRTQSRLAAPSSRLECTYPQSVKLFLQSDVPSQHPV